MNKKLDSPNGEQRYTIALLVRNFLGRDWIEFELHRPDMSDDFIQEFIEGSGYTRNHPEYDDLVQQARKTFTLIEAGEFLKCLALVDVHEFKVEPAVLTVPEYIKPEKGHRIAYPVTGPLAHYQFSKLKGYSLPFEVVGNYPD